MAKCGLGSLYSALLIRSYYTPDHVHDLSLSGICPRIDNQSISMISLHWVIILTEYCECIYFNRFRFQQSHCPYIVPLDMKWSICHFVKWQIDPHIFKGNEMNRALGRLCAHIGYTGPGEPPEDGEMIEMTLSSRHRIRNSSPGGLRPSTLPLGHGGSPQYWLSHVDGEETFLFLSNRRVWEPNPELWRERQRC